jgi:hypothetical protein
VIAGEAQDPKYMEMVRSAADAAHGVRLFSGRVPDDQVATFFSATDVVVLPLERALTSGTLVLAQSFGRTVVTSLSAEGVHEPSGETLAPSTGIFSDLHKALIDATTLNTENTIRPLASWWLIASQHAALLKTASSGV